MARVVSATIIVPCYNEASRLEPEAFLAYLRQDPAANFLFVNDGSRDATDTVLEKLKASAPERIDVLSLAVNGGKAEAVRRGILKAIEGGQAQAVGYWDADLATPLDEITRFCTVLGERSDVDLVMGSRVKLLGKDIQRKPLRHYLGRVFATGASMVLSLGVYDTQCGAKLFRVTPQLSSFFATPFISRWIFDVEILARMARAYRQLGSPHPFETALFELPLERWIDVKGSKVKPKDFFVALLELGRIYSVYR